MTVLLSTRRAFLGGLFSALAAPAIVHAANIMPVRNILILPSPTFESFDQLMPDGMQYQWNAINSNLYSAVVVGWRPVPASRYKDKFDCGGGDAVKVGGCILVERPKTASISARNKEIQQANQMVQRWPDRCLANGFDGGVKFTRRNPEWRTISGFGEDE